MKIIAARRKEIINIQYLRINTDFSKFNDDTNSLFVFPSSNEVPVELIKYAEKNNLYGYGDNEYVCFVYSSKQTGKFLPLRDSTPEIVRQFFLS